MQFLVIGRDGADAEALSRRMATREAHLAHIKKYKENKNILIGGPLLNHEGLPNGSVLIADFPDRAALDAYLQSDPYTVNGVWKQFEITEMRVVAFEG